MLKNYSKNLKSRRKKKITLFYDMSYNYETFFLFLLPKLELFCLSALKLKKPKKPTQTYKNKHTSGFWSILANIGNRTVKKEKGRLRKLPKEKVEDCQQAMRKEPHVHKEVFLPINIAVHFPFPSPFPFLLRPYLNTTLGAEVGFCASAGFFMSAGLLGLGDMVEGLGLAGASSLPPDSSSRGTPAMS